MKINNLEFQNSFFETTLGASVHWYDNCHNREGFLFYFPPTHIAQKLYQLGSNIASGLKMGGKKKKLAALAEERSKIEQQLERIESL